MISENVLRCRSFWLKVYSLLQQPGPKKFKLSKIELIYKAKKFIKFPRSLSKFRARLLNLLLRALGLEVIRFQGGVRGSSSTVDVLTDRTIL